MSSGQLCSLEPSNASKLSMKITWLSRRLLSSAMLLAACATSAQTNTPGRNTLDPQAPAKPGTPATPTPVPTPTPGQQAPTQDHYQQPLPMDQAGPPPSPAPHHQP